MYLTVVPNLNLRKRDRDKEKDKEGARDRYRDREKRIKKERTQGESILFLQLQTAQLITSYPATSQPVCIFSFREQHLHVLFAEMITILLVLKDI